MGRPLLHPPPVGTRVQPLPPLEVTSPSICSKQLPKPGKEAEAALVVLALAVLVLRLELAPL